MIIIDDEFQAAIPPLRPEEFAALEKSILTDGCRDPLVLWGCASRAEAQSLLGFSPTIWAGATYQRAEIALQLEDLLRAEAKGRQSTRTDLEPVHDIVPNLAPGAEQGKTRDAIAKAAGCRMVPPAKFGGRCEP